ncbi:MAG TPA: biopolymer transporter ExbD [Planctomycetaceae bacterium]|jgi:biopolymer transport protein ExbD|nr:biopolymer transporter ExbD [Planctomycetaceae bacterium]
MKIPGRVRGAGLKFNLTPMIDVVFNLIIFFLVASHYSRSEAVVDLELPKASGGEAEWEQSGRRLTITLLIDGRVFVGASEVNPGDLEDRLAASVATHGASEVEVRIRTDRRVPYARIAQILRECSLLGVQRLRFAVLTEK